ncbi:MAG TPA: BatA domain-containing protein [Candidatus Tectomicrobia bacterium]|nr:BatA domain-containing protein [Candidatus Tectomicrobia bacterium]
MGWLSFLNPAFLWGALAASIPVIIHLINRRRARTVRFPAVKFVLRSERRVARKYRVKQWLLLALRTLILFLLTTALAEPVLQPNVGDLAEINQTRAVVLILDNSMSMAYQAAGTHSWELAKEAAGLVLQELRPQDQGALLPLVAAGEPPQALSGDRVWLIQRVGELTQTYQAGDLIDSLQRAYTLLKTSDAAKKEIVVITDRTRVPWVGVEPATLRTIDPQVQMTVISVGPAGALDNTTVREVRLDQQAIVAGVRAKLTANVTNYGTEDRKQVPVRLLVDGKTLDQRLLDLPKRTTTGVAFDIGFDQPGYREGMITLGGDALPVDDQFYFAVPVRKALRVLLIDGDPRTTLVASETFYLMNALNPERASRLGPIQPRVVPVEEAERLRLGDFDIIVLANVRNLSQDLRARLMDFANQGGGLWWFLGHHVDPVVYNRSLFDVPTRLLPVRLGPPLDRPEAHPVTLQIQAGGHPLFKPFGDKGQDALAGVRVRRLISTETTSLPPSSRVLLALPDGRPLLLEGTAGKARVLLFTSTADVDWNELAVTTGYLPLIQMGMAYLAGRDAPERLAVDVRLPQPLTFKLAEPQKEALITVVDPQGKETRLFPQEREGQVQAESPATQVPGFYGVSVGQETAVVAGNTPLEESDINPFRPDEIREKFPGIPLAFVEWERGQPIRPPQVEPTSLAGWFLIGLLVLMLVEGVFANRLR